MPRKPYLSLVGRKRQSGDESIEVGTQAIDQHPELRSLVGACLMAWPFVEMELALILGQLLGSTTDAAMAVFQTIRRSAPQRDAISEAGRHALSEADQELLSAVLSVQKSIEADRNALAHGFFGHSSLLPKDYIWQETTDYLKHRSETILKNDTQWNRLKHEEIVKTFFVYTKDDLEQIRSDIIELGEILHAFLRYLKHLHLGGPLLSQLRRQLCERPHMARELVRLHREKTLQALGGRGLPEPEC
jgi:hypothetical protein